MAEGARTPRWRQLVPWATVLALGGIAVTIYFGLVSRRPHPVFETVSVSNVLDIHRELGELTVLFRGKDIQAEGLNLRIYTVRLRNAGSAPLRPTDFDPTVLWGLEFAGCEVVDVRVADTNDKEYLQPRFTDWVMSLRKGGGEAPQAPADKGRVELPACLMNPGDHVVLEVLVLHPTAVEPRVSAHGKVAGASLSLTAKPAGPGKPLAWLRGASQGPSVVAGLLLGVVLIPLVLFFPEKWFELRRRRRGRARVRRLRGTECERLAPGAAVLYGLAERTDWRGMSLLRRLLMNRRALVRASEALPEGSAPTSEEAARLFAALAQIDPAFSEWVVDPPPNAGEVLASVQRLRSTALVRMPGGAAPEVDRGLLQLIKTVESLMGSWS